jgi:hypothetical protein
MVEEPMVELTDQQWQSLASEDPPRVTAPHSKETFVLVREETYLLMKDALEEKIDIRTAYPLMDAVAAKEGWADPEMDIYNDFAKRP